MSGRWFVGVVLAASLGVAAPLLGSEETLTFGRFGKVSLYYQVPHPSRVVLFVSGDGGWNRGVVDMARELTSLDALVVGVDIVHYLKELRSEVSPCSYPAADFEMLSKYVQKKLGFPQYVTPVLVGYSSGATLVYATLVQAPPNTFRGAISLGFCPDLLLTRPLCRGSGLEWEPGPKGKGYVFLPAAGLEVPWIAFQGLVDQVCDPSAVEKYVQKVGHGEIIALPRVGHGFSVERNWLPQFRQAFSRLVEPPPAPEAGAGGGNSPPVVQAPGELKDLPLVEVPVSDSTTQVMAVEVTGDGGWGVTDRGIARALAAQGIPAVGLNSLQYFWKRRTPDEAAKDLERVLQHYLAAWHREKVVLIGYSLGAEVLPFMVNRLPESLRARIDQVVLLAPGERAEFEFHLTEWIASSSGPGALPVLPEVEKLKGIKITCWYGDKDEGCLCPRLSPDLARVELMKGGHRIGEHYGAIVDSILAVVRGK